MSWWIGVEIDTGGDEPTDLADRSVTYNVARMFIEALAILDPGVHTPSCRCGKSYRVKRDGDWVDEVQQDHEYGLPALHGAPCVEAAGALRAAIGRMDADPAKYKALNPANGWGSADSAREDLVWLLEQCQRHPKATIYIH